MQVLVHMYEVSTHLRLLVVQVLCIMAAYCLLPFMMSLHVCCELLCCACAGAHAVQVRLPVLCVHVRGAGVCTGIFFVCLLQHLIRYLYATIFVYIVSPLHPWFFLELQVMFFFSFLLF